MPKEKTPEGPNGGGNDDGGGHNNDGNDGATMVETLVMTTLL
jgi:hypothetical protein